MSIELKHNERVALTHPILSAMIIDTEELREKGSRMGKIDVQTYIKQLEQTINNLKRYW